MLTIFETIEKIAIKIDHAIKTEDLGYSDTENTSGEDQLKLDVKSDYIVEEAFKNVSIVKALVSEEKEGVLALHDEGKYTICYDPLDGSSLADVNLSVGSIFGIYEGELKAENLVASAYVVYGPRIELVTATRDAKPKHYRAQEGLFNFISEISLDEKGKLNAPGGTQQNWSKVHKTFVDGLFAEGYRLRYSGGMVPDLHQILLKGGGIFSYPGTSDKPNGKLRQLFEVIPFAFMYEQAGGQAISNEGVRLMELIPAHPHDTSPCFFGSNYEINKLKEAYGMKV
ncbi:MULTISPECIES: class 1 fructose-bisphosphatase [Sulfurovum]|uniref:Fructose-1,6-bisphosphatase class 1 n=1 Tax=Sulfurovum xiamenensis TaxID=3019066 RepID=A0ABT7QUC5_9BACT|nr:MULTISPECIES: class 1 fructose-bisphosphatase [Sulfurovum]EIF51434.1 fructose-1,6-bisphosphatase [Sulfurovum sp. AR]MDM5264620.1 class 1 fructose-bisphosphatase [Sulfurovum xiamenensis]